MITICLVITIPNVSSTVCHCEKTIVTVILRLQGMCHTWKDMSWLLGPAHDPL